MKAYEKKDFPVNRRGYDTEAVDAHLTSLASEVEDLTDPMRYFSAGGSPDALEHNVKRVMEDVSTFLDLGSVESYPTAEYILRSLPA